MPQLKSHDEKLKNELLSRGLLSNDQVKKLQAESLKGKGSFKEIVLKMGFLKEEDVVFTEADVLGVSFLDLEQYLIDEKVVHLVPEKIARGRSIMPVFKIGNTLTVATADPLDILALDEVRRASDSEVETVMSTKSTIKRAIDQYYGAGSSLKEVVQNYDRISPKALKAAEDALASVEDLGKVAEEAPVIQLVNLLILRALEEKASDIHIEPEGDLLRVRTRVDGLMHEATTLPKKMHLAIVSRVKIMARLDIAETRKPQDGKIRLRIESRELDIRVSTFPTTHGENVVMRLLETSSVILGLPELGFDGENLRRMDGLIHKAYGMILVTGPTGAGKTTTLYSALNTINSIEKNIITIEDPVEYELPLIRQTQVNPKAGLTFATGLRSILRQDPDVILVGEIRDSETADIAVQAALTGHLVFATVHTNDAAGAVARLLDMKIEPFLIASALIGVLGQRLVRTLCPKCREKYEPDPALLKKLEVQPNGAAFCRPKGCSNCKNGGYVGRSGVFELLTVDEPVRRLILERGSSQQIKAQALKAGMTPMRADGIRKAAKGITTLEEVFKVTQEESDPE